MVGICATVGVFIHRQPGGLPHRGQDGGQHRLGGVLGASGQGQVWSPAEWNFLDISESKSSIRNLTFFGNKLTFKTKIFEGVI